MSTDDDDTPNIIFMLGLVGRTYPQSQETILQAIWEIERLRAVVVALDATLADRQSQLDFLAGRAAVGRDRE